MNLTTSSPLLDACLLGVLSRGDAYGYSLTQQLKDHLGISESTLYPILRRLQKDGCLSVYDQPFQGRNRRYYTLTSLGAARLAECRSDWRSYASKINHILQCEGDFE